MALYQVGTRDSSQEDARALLEGARLVAELMSRRAESMDAQFANAVKLYTSSGGYMTRETYEKAFPQLAARLPYDQFVQSFELGAKLSLEGAKAAVAQAQAAVDQVSAYTEQLRTQTQGIKDEQLRKKVEHFNSVVEKQAGELRELSKTYTSIFLNALNAGNDAAVKEAMGKLEVLQSVSNMLGMFTRVVASNMNPEAVSELTSKTDGFDKVLKLLSTDADKGGVSSDQAKALANVVVSKTVIDLAGDGFVPIEVIKRLDIGDEGKRELAKAAAFKLVRSAAKGNAEPSIQAAAKLLASFGVDADEAGAIVKQALTLPAGAEGSGLVSALDELYTRLMRYTETGPKVAAASQFLKQAVELNNRLQGLMYKAIDPVTGAIVEKPVLPGGAPQTVPKVEGFSMPQVPELFPQAPAPSYSGQTVPFGFEIPHAPQQLQQPQPQQFQLFPTHLQPQKPQQQPQLLTQDMLLGFGRSSIR